MVCSVNLVTSFVTIIAVGSFSLIFTILYSHYTKSLISEIDSGKCDLELLEKTISNEQPNEKKNKKITGLLKPVIFYISMALIIPLFLFAIINKIQGNVTMISSNGVMVVASGSMSEKNKANDYLITNNLNNQFDTYDIIVIQKLENQNELSIYDVIAFKDEDGKHVIHRIIAKEIVDGEIRYVTRGDSNNSNDSYKPRFEDVIGKYTEKRIPVIGIFILFFQSSAGIITLISLFYCVMMIDKYNKRIKDKEEERLLFLKEYINYSDESEDYDFKIEQINVLTYKDNVYYFKGYELIKQEKITNDQIESEDINTSEESRDNYDN